MWACGTPGSRRQKGNSSLTCSSPQPFTGFSQGRLALSPGGFLSDPDHHSLHDTHTLPYVSGGPWSGENSMSLPHGRILLKIWGQIISWPFHWATEFSAFRRLRLGRDNTRSSLAPTTMLASMSTEQQNITAGEGQEASGKSLGGQVPWEASKLQVERGHYKNKTKTYGNSASTLSKRVWSWRNTEGKHKNKTKQKTSNLTY